MHQVKLMELSCTKVVFTNQVEISTRMIVSKSRVAPLKATSIPQLELLGAILGLKLAKKVVETYGIELKSVVFWCDSMNVLWWIKQHSRKFKPFVANLISEMQSATYSCQWKYVPTKSNPADFVTRCSTV